MEAFRLAKHSFHFPLTFVQFALEVDGALPFLDPIDLLSMRATVHKACAMLIFLRKTRPAYRALATMSAEQAITLDQAMVKFLVRIQIVTLGTPIPILFALIAKVAAAQLTFAQMF